MNTILITYNPSLDSEILKDRIKSLGDYYNFWNNHWIVKTKDGVKEVYNKLSRSPLEKELILVVKFSKYKEGCFGRMNTRLWKWLYQVDN